MLCVSHVYITSGTRTILIQARIGPLLYVCRLMLEWESGRLVWSSSVFSWTSVCHWTKSLPESSLTHLPKCLSLNNVRMFIDILQRYIVQGHMLLGTYSSFAKCQWTSIEHTWPEAGLITMSISHRNGQHFVWLHCHFYTQMATILFHFIVSAIHKGPEPCCYMIITRSTLHFYQDLSCHIHTQSQMLLQALMNCNTRTWIFAAWSNVHSHIRNCLLYTSPSPRD